MMFYSFCSGVSTLVSPEAMQDRILTPKLPFSILVAQDIV